jgi:hypothetical protein
MFCVLDLHALVWEGSALVFGPASRTHFYIQSDVSLPDQTLGKSCLVRYFTVRYNFYGKP